MIHKTRQVGARGLVGDGGPGLQGRAVQVDPIKPALKATGSDCLKLKCDDMLSNFAFKLNLRLYNKGLDTQAQLKMGNGQFYGFNYLQSVSDTLARGFLNSVSAFQETLISSKPRVYLLKIRDQVEQSASRSVGHSKWTVLIGGTRFDTISSIPDPTLSSRTSTRPTFCQDEASPRVCTHMSIHPEGESCRHVRCRFECLFSTTLLAGAGRRGVLAGRSAEVGGWVRRSVGC
jgi:hypothetical protein